MERSGKREGGRVSESKLGGERRRIQKESEKVLIRRLKKAKRERNDGEIETDRKNEMRGKERCGKGESEEGGAKEGRRKRRREGDKESWRKQRRQWWGAKEWRKRRRGVVKMMENAKTWGRLKNDGRERMTETSRKRRGE